MFAQNNFSFIVRRDNKWISMANSAVNVLVRVEDTSYSITNDWGILPLKSRKDLLSHQEQNDIYVTITVEDGWKVCKKSVYTITLQKKDLILSDMLVLDIDSKKEKINHKLYKKECSNCVEIQQCCFSIDGRIDFEIDSILCVSCEDTLPLIYSIGKLCVDSTHLHVWNRIKNKELTLQLYYTNKYYIIPFAYIGKNHWYVFVRNRSRKKYNVGWWDCNRLSYCSILDLYGRKGAFH